jgi:beta-glucanase (GH16 family)
MTSYRCLLLVALSAACTQPPVDDPLPTPPVVGNWRQTWSDDFDGPANTAPDRSKWAYDIGGHGWGNRQLEFDTDQLSNAHLDGDGALVITAIKQKYGNNEYTSARLRTQDRFQQRYGRFEARMRLPEGAGLWPAFWLLGSNLASAGWPACGELDVMEHRGREPGTIHGSAHGPGYSGDNPKTDSYTLPAGDSFADDYHVFAIEWSPDEVHWFVDKAHYHALRADSMPSGQPWVFDGPMFMIVNLAVGGWFGGDVDDAIFPRSMQVDYVRAYEAIDTP